MLCFYKHFEMEGKISLSKSILLKTSSDDQSALALIDNKILIISLTEKGMDQGLSFLCKSRMFERDFETGGTDRVLFHNLGTEINKSLPIDINFPARNRLILDCKVSC